MSIVRISAHRVKPTRRTPRPAAPFGAGILTRPHRFEPTPEDRQWAAETFGNHDPDWDVLAAEAAGYNAVMAGLYA